MGNWSEIPEEFARKIAMEHLENVDDFEAFGAVCSVWKHAIDDVTYFCPLKNTQLPWLTLADPPQSPYRRFYSLSKRMFRKVELPKDDEDDHRINYSSKGWLISVSRQNRNVTLFNPFSGEVIKPPSIPHEFVESFYTDDVPWGDTDYINHFQKFILSSDSSSCDDFAVAMIFDKTQKLAFWNPGQLNWTKPIVDFEIDWVLDVCFLKGEFYAIDHHGLVMAFGNGTLKPRIIANLGPNAPDNVTNYYIVPGFTENTLLVVHRDVVIPGDEKYETELCETYEVNIDDGKGNRIDSIGNRAIFVGISSSFFVEASSPEPHEHSCRADCIYFTDDYYEGIHDESFKGGSDMGIYSLKERRIIDRIYEGPSQFCHISPPMWVELPHQGRR